MHSFLCVTQYILLHPLGIPHRDEYKHHGNTKVWQTSKRALCSCRWDFSRGKCLARMRIEMEATAEGESQLFNPPMGHPWLWKRAAPFCMYLEERALKAACYLSTHASMVKHGST
eukprot:scaffold253088_cov14-Tisochrysis_lutea.AAC.1